MVLFIIILVLLAAFLILYLTGVIKLSEYEKIEEKKTKDFYKISLIAFLSAQILAFFFFILGEVLDMSIRMPFRVIGIVLLIGSLVYAIVASFIYKYMIRKYYQTPISDENIETRLENIEEDNKNIVEENQEIEEDNLEKSEE